MTFSRGYWQTHTVKLSIGGFTGAVGDSVTVIPIVVATATLTELSLPHLLLGFAAFQIVWGLYYGLPVSVEPMKALAALVIGGTLAADELAIAGLLAGGVLLVVGWTSTLGHIEQYVGQPVIRGVQIAVALILLETGIHLSLDGLPLALGATAIAGIVVVAGYRRASALAVLCVGVVLTVAQTGLPAPQLPTLSVQGPRLAAVSPAVLEGTAAQLVMTVGNAAVATSLLLSEYYDANVSVDELATSMGVMNLIAIPFGAMPMCHGNGGVAGKYAFCARTAGANLILGVVYAIAAAVAVGVVTAFPLSMLGVILAVIALELGRTGLDTEHLTLSLSIGLLGVMTNVGVAFIVGIAGDWTLRRL